MLRAGPARRAGTTRPSLKPWSASSCRAGTEARWRVARAAVARLCSPGCGGQHSAAARAIAPAGGRDHAAPARLRGAVRRPGGPPVAATRSCRTLLAQREAAYELPWSHAVLRMLEVEDSEQDPTTLGARLGRASSRGWAMPPGVGFRAPEIRRRRGRWHVVRVVRSTPATIRSETEASERTLDAGRAQATSSVNRRFRRQCSPTTCSRYSQRDYERIQALQLGFYEEVRSLVQKAFLRAQWRCSTFSLCRSTSESELSEQPFACAVCRDGRDTEDFWRFVGR